MVDRLDRLRHDAVVGGDDQHDDVRHLGAAGAHGGEGRVAGRVDERDGLAARRGHLIGADMLGDAAGFAGDDVRLADGVEQRGLAVVDVAHDRDDGRTRLERAFRVGRVEQAFLDVGFGDALDRVAEFFGDELRGVGVDHVGDLVHRALAHQHLDHVDRALGHAVGEFLDGDRLGQHDFAGELFLLRPAGKALQALHAAPEGGDRARALFLAAGGGGDGQAAAALFLAGRGAGRARRHDHLGRHAGAANDALGLFLLRRAGGTGDRRHGDRARRSARRADRRAGSRSRGRCGRAAFAQAALGLFLGAALGFCVVLAAGLFLALARFGGLALGALLRLALGAGARLDLGDAAFFLLAPLGVEQGAGAGLALLFRQGAQDDAGRARAGRLGGWRGAGTGAAGRGLGGSGSSLDRGGRRSGRRRLRLGRGGLGSAEDAPLHLLDHDLLRAAVGEALPHDA